MAEGKRPGGLTALAVINFLFAVISVLGILGMVALIALSESGEIMDETAREMKQAFEDAGIGTGLLAVIFALNIITTILLVCSGIGYLKLKKFLGRGLGNAYAFLSIAGSLASALIMPVKAGGGFNLAFLIGIIYPLITLILINTTFKEDLVN